MKPFPPPPPKKKNKLKTKNWQIKYSIVLIEIALYSTEYPFVRQKVESVYVALAPRARPEVV